MQAKQEFDKSLDRHTVTMDSIRQTEDIIAQWLYGLRTEYELSTRMSFTSFIMMFTYPLVEKLHLVLSNLADSHCESYSKFRLVDMSATLQINLFSLCR